MLINRVVVLDIMIFCGNGEASERSEKDLVFVKVFLTKDMVYYKDSIVKFDNVIANIGNGYNPNSGVFTAPVTGYYLISAILATGGNGAGDFAIKKNSEWEGVVTIKDQNSIAPLTTVAHVRKGEHVFIIRHYGGGKQVRGWRFAQFTVFLLRAD